MIHFSNKDKQKGKEVKTLAEEFELTVERDDVDELGFPRKRLTETQREYVDKLYEKERGSSGVAIPTTRSVIFEIVKNNDPFGLKVNEPAVIDTPDNKWWHRWNSWLEEKCKNEEEKKKRAEEQVKIIGELMDSNNQKQKQQQQQKASRP